MSHLSYLTSHISRLGAIELDQAATPTPPWAVDLTPRGKPFPHVLCVPSVSTAYAKIDQPSGRQVTDPTSDARQVSLAFWTQVAVRSDQIRTTDGAQHTYLERFVLLSENPVHRARARPAITVAIITVAITIAMTVAVMRRHIARNEPLFAQRSAHVLAVRMGSLSIASSSSDILPFDRCARRLRKTDKLENLGALLQKSPAVEHIGVQQPNRVILGSPCRIQKRNVV